MRNEALATETRGDYVHLQMSLRYQHDCKKHVHGSTLLLGKRPVCCVCVLRFESALRQWRRGTIAMITTLPVLNCSVIQLW